MGIAGIGKGPGRKDYRWDKNRTLEEGLEHWAVSRDLQRLYSSIKRRFLGCRETWKQYAGGMEEGQHKVSLAVWTLVAVVLGPVLRALLYQEFSKECL